MFQKSASDMIKGVRAHPRDEASYVATCITEIKEELRSTMQGTKQQAVLKLVYLEMMGYDVQWASFHFVDVMSFPRFRGKRIGFLAAQQCFHSGTDVLLLTTNLFRRAFASSSPYEVCLGVSTLAKIATPELSRDLLTEVSSMLSSSRSLVRKKAVLALYRLLQNSPETLPTVFPRLREKLDDPDPAVVACAVNVLVELAAHNPKGYLGLAPPLYRVLTSSGSNWTLIKVVKFMRQLVPHEPRLGKKLVEPLLHLIQTTQARSLQYECLATVAATMTSHPELVALAVTKLREFVEHEDPNLKYLGLVALHVLQAADRRLVEGCREIVLGCITTDDPTVRSQALGLVAGMVSKDNLTEIVAQLMRQLDSPDTTHRDELVLVVLQACRCDGFAHVPSFKWLVSCLIALLRIESAHGGDAADQLVEVALRVPAVRGFAAERCQHLLLAATQQQFAAAPPAAALRAAATTLAEHGALLPRPAQLEALRALLAPGAASLPPQVQASFVQAATRLFSQLPPGGAAAAAAAAAGAAAAAPAVEGDLVGLGGDAPTPPRPPPPSAAASGAAAEAEAELAALLGELLGALPRFCGSDHVEVHERALCLQQLLLLLRDAAPGAERAALHGALRAGLAPELKAVAPNAQRKVRVPKGFDLDAPIHPEAAPPPPPTGAAPPPTSAAASAASFYDDEVPGTAAAGQSPAQQPAQPQPSPQQQQQPKRQQPTGVFYLQTQEAASAVVAAAEAAASAPERAAAAPSTEAPTFDGGGATGGVGLMGAGGGWDPLAEASALEDEAGAVVNLDNAMPSDAEDDDDAPAAAGGAQRKHRRRRSDRSGTATSAAAVPAAEGSLIDLMEDGAGAGASGPPEEAAGAAPTKQRRRRTPKSGPEA